MIIFGPASIALKNGTIASGILPPVRAIFVVFNYLVRLAVTVI